MTKHLISIHRVNQKAEAENLADQCRVPIGRKFWSCGFCIVLFLTENEQLKHICNRHAKKGHSYDSMNLSNVNRGLLLQPQVNEAWDAVLTARYGSNAPDLFWHGPQAEDLRLQLELGPTNERSAQSLADTALITAYDPTDAFSNQLQENTAYTFQNPSDQNSWESQTSAPDTNTTRKRSPNVTAARAVSFSGNGFPGLEAITSSSAEDYDLRCFSSSECPASFSTMSADSSKAWWTRTNNG